MGYDLPHKQTCWYLYPDVKLQIRWLTSPGTVESFWTGGYFSYQPVDSYNIVWVVPLMGFKFSWISCILSTKISYCTAKWFCILQILTHKIVVAFKPQNFKPLKLTKSLHHWWRCHFYIVHLQFDPQLKFEYTKCCIILCSLYSITWAASLIHPLTGK